MALKKKILILNGSPKGPLSATMNITNAFVKGICEQIDAEVEIVELRNLNIKPCLGCLSCWGKTPGKCVLKGDDIEMIRQKINDCDIFIESYGLYFFGMPGTMKVFTDRMMPLMSTYRGQKPPVNGESFHGLRFEQPQKFVVISSCAYSNSDAVYEALEKEYDCICGKNKYTHIFASQIKTLIDLNTEDRTNKYLQKFIDAGHEFALNGFLSEETSKNLKKPPFSDGAYKVLLDKFWSDEEERGKKL